MASFLSRDRISSLIIKKDTSIKDALNVIGKGGIQCCFIEESNKFYGIVTDSDLRKGLLAGNTINDAIS